MGYKAGSLSKASKRKMSESQRKRFQNPEERAKALEASKKGILALQKLEAENPELRQARMLKQSRTRKKRMKNPEYRARAMAGVYKPRREETLQLISGAAKKQHRLEREQIKKQGFRICESCDKKKPLKRFRYRTNGSRPVGWRRICRLCYRKLCALRTWQRANPEAEFSFAEYQRLFIAQRGRCRICKQKEAKGRLLSLDHSHKTQEVRGLLCKNCNIGLGHFRDSVKLLKKAIKYLRGEI